MPRSFNELESNLIRKKLIQLGLELFPSRGLKKTSIEELASGAGIAKGSFYKFYPSKEALCFACLETQEKEFREKTLTPLMNSHKNRKDILQELIKTIFTMTETYPIIAMVLDPTEYEALMRGLPEDILEKHKANDEDLMSAMLSGLLGAKQFNHDEQAINIKGLNGLFWLLALLNIHKPELGDAFTPATDLMAEVISRGIDSVLTKKEES